MSNPQTFIIEICPSEGATSVCRLNGARVSPKSTLFTDLADCCKSGDCREACRHVLTTYRPQFRTVRRMPDNASGGRVYANVLASDAELQACCETIYFESNTDFADRDNCELYLVWNAAMDCTEDRD